MASEWRCITEQRKKSPWSKVNLSVEQLCEAGAALEKLSTKPRTDYHFLKRITSLFKQISDGNHANDFFSFFFFFTQAGWKQ